MTFKQSLQGIWNTVNSILNGDLHGSHHPSPDVRQELESKGYKFKFQNVSCGHYSGGNYRITSPDNKLIGSGFFKDDDVTRQYYADYQQAVETVKNTPQP